MALTPFVFKSFAEITLVAYPIINRMIYSAIKSINIKSVHLVNLRK
jgi:hypothetical protein